MPQIIPTILQSSYNKTVIIHFIYDSTYLYLRLIDLNYFASFYRELIMFKHSHKASNLNQVFKLSFFRVLNWYRPILCKTVISVIHKKHIYFLLLNYWCVSEETSFEFKIWVFQNFWDQQSEDSLGGLVISWILSDLFRYLKGIIVLNTSPMKPLRDFDLVCHIIQRSRAGLRASMWQS